MILVQIQVLSPSPKRETPSSLLHPRSPTRACVAFVHVFDFEEFRCELWVSCLSCRHHSCFVSLSCCVVKESIWTCTFCRCRRESLWDFSNSLSRCNRIKVNLDRRSMQDLYSGNLRELCGLRQLTITKQDENDVKTIWFEQRCVPSGMQAC